MEPNPKAGITFLTGKTVYWTGNTILFAWREEDEKFMKKKKKKTQKKESRGKID